ncbi:hypothetical protein LTR08_007034 [Meristemomyces frigidus]|nr:hypothetical protein LTR08_007034 [Meristemomyces frigidus]
MAEDGRFRSKIGKGWSKVLKVSDAPPPPGHTNSFKLNEDVVDFLKPSTDKSSGTRPKINVAVASRWPAAHEVKRASETSIPTQQQLETPQSGYRKPKRRPGLSVRFVKTVPEVMGEGGDHAPDPPSEISRQKAMVMRSVSDRRPVVPGDGGQWSGSQAPRQQPPRQARPPSGPEESFRPQPVRRVQTSHNELSPPVQRKVVSPPLEPPPFHRPSLGRTPTGFNSQDENKRETTMADDDEHPMPYARNSGDAREGREERHPRYDSARPGLLSATPRNPTVRRQRDMQANEGMALRRASALYMDDNNEDEVEQANSGFQPPAQFYNTLSEPSASQGLREAPATQLSPESALSPEGPSPFADPKYAKRRSGEHVPAPRQPAAPQSMRQPRPVEQPSYMRAAQPSQPSQSCVASDPRPSREQPSYMRAMQPPAGDILPSRPAPTHHHTTSVSRTSPRQESRSPVRDRMPDSQVPAHSNGSATHFPPPPQPRPQQHRVQTHGQNPASHYSPASSTLAPGSAGNAAISPHARGPSPADYFSAPRAPPMQSARSPAANLRQEETARPGSSGSTRSVHRPAPSPQPLPHGDPAADTSLADFAGRVAHMKGVFKLTAEKERSGERCSPHEWLRAGLWWYLRGKAGLETLLQRRPSSPERPRELLTQPHVDLAKTWWIISEPLEAYDILDGQSPQSAPSYASSEQDLQHSVTLLRNHLRSLCVSMLRSQLMPPFQSLIQGQDTCIWTPYPRFTSDATAVLSGNASKSLVVTREVPVASPVEALPLGDSRDAFCYGRFAVEVSLNTDDADTDRVVLPCILTMLRGKHDYQTGISIASQNELVNIKVGPKASDAKGLTWHEVSWKASSNTMVIQLPRGFDLTVRMQERDFRSLSHVVDHARKVERSFRVEAGEELVHQTRLAELQYADPCGKSAFPQDKLRACKVLVFERAVEHRDGSGIRKMHRGYRLLLVTDSSHKSLNSVSHELCQNSPLLFEFITDTTANGATAMVIRVPEGSKQCRILLIFSDSGARQALYDVLNGLAVGPDETIVGKMSLASLNIQAASQTEGFTPVGHSALQGLQWQKLGVTNHYSQDPNTRLPDTVESETLRIVARHAAGCITDRMNLGKGELLLRLPCADTAVPSIQVLRSPQEDLTMSVETRLAPQLVVEGITELLTLAQQQPTIRTFTFATSADLHAFQAAITGFTVRYDGIASTFGISRRMMVVPIYHKRQAAKVRVQVVTQSSITQVLAFMEDFSHADALCIKVMSTDTFETVKGDSKGKKWAVKMVDAKFTLPKQEKGEIETVERVRRRFVNLEGLNYAEEHDDITIGFDTEEGMSRQVNRFGD